jgi:hypothetical protein
MGRPSAAVWAARAQTRSSCAAWGGEQLGFSVGFAEAGQEFAETETKASHERAHLTEVVEQAHDTLHVLQGQGGAREGVQGGVH